jgi:transcriptional regulator GlxA family with amidase domain
MDLWAVHYATYLLTVANQDEPVSHLFSPRKLQVQFHVVPERYLTVKRRKKKINRRLVIPQHELKRLQMLFEEIQAHPEVAVTVALLSRKAGMSKKKLETLFKFHYQKTIREVINDERIARAKQLLKDTDLSVAEIAEQTGYNNAAAFIKFFKNKCIITPLQYRHREKED